MIPLLKHLMESLLNDELAVKRWLRSTLMALAGSGIAFSDQMAAALGNMGIAKHIKIAAVIAGFVSVAINLGEKNEATENKPTT